jgi:hypothetical protein
LQTNNPDRGIAPRTEVFVPKILKTRREDSFSHLARAIGCAAGLQKAHHLA